MLPSLQQAMFAKAHFVTAAVSMQNLALLRPERVLPDLIDKYAYFCVCVWGGGGGGVMHTYVLMSP